MELLLPNFPKWPLYSSFNYKRRTSQPENLTMACTRIETATFVVNISVPSTKSHLGSLKTSCFENLMRQASIESVVSHIDTVKVNKSS
jgi:hypothetical protein